MPYTATKPAPVRLDQRGRAELEFLGSLRTGLASLRAEVSETLSAPSVLGTNSPETLTEVEELRRRGDGAVAGLAGQRTIGAVLRYVRLAQTPRAVEAFERSRDRLEKLALPSARVRDAVAGEPPRYWTYEFHGTAGGWDGHEHMGFVHHELVYQYLLVAAYPGDLTRQRGEVAAAAPRANYGRICDLGAGTGQYTMKLAETYPGAEITAVDLSRSELAYSLRRAEDAGVSWDAVRAPAEATGLPGGSFDLVTSFILLHELPPHACRAVFAEAFRLLAEDGHVHMSDVAPYRERSPVQAWLDDWEAENGFEPWWRTAALADLDAILRETGFVDVRQQALGSGGYPWVVTARKPREQV